MFQVYIKDNLTNNNNQIKEWKLSYFLISTELGIFALSLSWRDLCMVIFSLLLNSINIWSHAILVWKILPFRQLNFSLSVLKMSLPCLLKQDKNCLSKKTMIMFHFESQETCQKWQVMYWMKKENLNPGGKLFLVLNVSFLPFTEEPHYWTLNILAVFSHFCSLLPSIFIFRDRYILKHLWGKMFKRLAYA